MTRQREAATWALITTIVVLAASAAATGSALAQDAESNRSPGAEVVQGDGGAPGDQLIIAGSDWEPLTWLSAAVCGNRGQRGSIDCVSLGRSFLSRSDGSADFTTTLLEPPSSCPCIVRVRSVDTPDQAFVPIELQGMEVEDPVPLVDAPSESSPPLVVDTVSVTGGGWRSWFGLPDERTVEIVVANPSDVDVGRPPLAVAWGRGPDPEHLVEMPPVDRIAAGETVTLTADFTTSILAFGTYEVSGLVGPAWGSTAFGTTISTWPWTLIAAGFALTLAVAGRIVVRVARSRASEASQETPTEEEEEEEEESSPADDLEVVWLDELAATFAARLDLHTRATMSMIERTGLAEAVGVEVITTVTERIDLSPRQISELADRTVSEIMTTLEALFPSDDDAITRDSVAGV